jgi:hypothetical protein
MENKTPTIDELKKAFSLVEKHNLVPNALYCAVCGQGINFKTKEGSLCNHLRQDFGMPLLPEEEPICNT